MYLRLAIVDHGIVHVDEDVGYSVLINYNICRSFQACGVVVNAESYTLKLVQIIASLENSVFSFLAFDKNLVVNAL